MNVLEEGTKEALKKYLANCAKHADIDQDIAYKTTITCMKAHDGIAVDVQNMHEMKLLEDRWYASLPTGTPDYSVYSSPYYFCEVWMCWSKYSRRYLKDIQSTKSMAGKSIVQDMVGVNTVLDLGCGFGYTTAGLKDIFPNANVYGTNIEESAQYKMATELGQEHNFKIISDHKMEADFVFASEYFEHFYNPIEHLLDVIKHCQPKYFIIANTFNSKAIGHFNEYIYQDKIYPGKTMSKMFNDMMRQQGYEKVATNCWNNRPAYWKRTQNSLESFL
jgi:2-polyprenyl-3-methyl-5-hydroxy-6-metoxy-1,4-benzoquinol methylase